MAEEKKFGAEEKLNLKNLEMEKTRKIVAESEFVIEELKEQLGVKVIRNRKIKDLHEIDVLIGNFRRKQIFN